jgi:hypothetical protein
MRGRQRCKWHGGCSTGPRTAEGLARTLAAARAGRERWKEQMLRAIAMGEIERFPGGRPKGSKGKPKGKMTVPRKAQPTAPAAAPVPPVPITDDMTKRAELVEWNGKTPFQKLGALTAKALDMCNTILSLPLADENNPRLLSAQKDVALSLLMLQFKVGEAAAEREAREHQRQEILAGIARQVAERG